MGHGFRSVKRRRARNWSHKLTGHHPSSRTMSTVRDLTSVGVMETKTQPFGTLGAFMGNYPPTDGPPSVCTETTDDGVLSTKIFNFGHGSSGFPAGKGIGQTNEIALQPYRLGNPPDQTRTDTVAASGTGPSQVIGKQIFARESHLTIHMRYAVPDLPYQWTATGGVTGAGNNEVNWSGSPTWYTPINYRILIVKFKRDKWPSSGITPGGGSFPGQQGFFGGPLLDDTPKNWYPTNQTSQSTPTVCVQSAVNRCLFIDHYGGYFGVGNLEGLPTQASWHNQAFDSYMAMSQPVASKYFDVIHEKKGTIKPPSVLVQPNVDIISTAGVVTGLTGEGMVPEV